VIVSQPPGYRFGWADKTISDVSSIMERGATQPPARRQEPAAG
jgi:hypothetical protein